MSNLNRYLYGTVFLTGAAVLIIEVAAVRILSPHYGSSLYVFSSVLTVILGALSVGYWYGGRRADQKHSIDELYKIIALSGLIVLILLLAAIFFLPMFGSLFSVKAGPLIFSIGLFFTPAFLLGIISPYVIKLQSVNTPSDQIGSVVGNTFFWGTVGSILGSIATGFWLIPTFGVQQTILLVSILLISLGLVTPLFLNRPVRTTWMLSIVSTALLFGGFIYFFNTSLSNIYVYSSEGIYSSIRVSDHLIYDRPARLMRRDTNNSSAIFLEGNELVFDYAKFIELYPLLKPDTKEVLVLGGGAYTMPRWFIDQDATLNIDVVEIEPVLFEIAQEYFDLTDTSQITNYPMDARVFLAQTSKKYDFIIGDSFSTDMAAPFHLTTVEYYALVKDRLTPDGIFMLNYAGKTKGPRPSLTGSLIKTIGAVFPNTRVFHVEPDATPLQNIIFISRNGATTINVSDADITRSDGRKMDLVKQELDLTSYNLDLEILLTDDHSPVEYLMAKQR